MRLAKASLDRQSFSIRKASFNSLLGVGLILSVGCAEIPDQALFLVGVSGSACVPLAVAAFRPLVQRP